MWCAKMTDDPKEHKPRPNLVRITANMYVLRTQAGYRKLLKNVVADFEYLENGGDSYPMFYPCVCHIHRHYEGAHYVRLTFTRIEKAIEDLQKQEMLLREQL